MSIKARGFEYRDEKSSKFWEITLTDTSVVVRFGKTGTHGQTQEKGFADAAAAAKHAAKLIAAKTGKGYIEVTPTEQPGSPPPQQRDSDLGVSSHVTALPVVRSAETAAQLARATHLRDSLLSKLSPAKPAVEVSGRGRRSKPRPKSDLEQTLELAAEGWAPVLQEFPVGQVDRRLSMICGPYFSSDEYPMSRAVGEALLPVVQLDPKEILEMSTSRTFEYKDDKPLKFWEVARSAARWSGRDRHI